ncbi:MAG: AsmA-like C-terminal region-containing protein [Candidatus Eisenbacteria bacterium]
MATSGSTARSPNFRVLDPRTLDQPGTSRADLVIRSERLDLDSFAPPAAAAKGASSSGGATPTGVGASGGGGGGVGSGGTGGGGSAGAGSAGAASGFELFAGFVSRLSGPISLQVGTARMREMDWSHVNGRGALDAGQIRIDAMDLEAFGSKLAATGTVNLRNPKNPAFDLGVQATSLEASRFFTDNPGLSKLSGLGGFVQGTVDLTAQTTGSLDETFQLDLKSLTSLGNFEMEGGKITGRDSDSARRLPREADLRTLDPGLAPAVQDP